MPFDPDVFVQDDLDERRSIGRPVRRLALHPPGGRCGHQEAGEPEDAGYDGEQRCPSRSRSSQQDRPDCEDDERSLAEPEDAANQPLWTSITSETSAVASKVRSHAGPMAMIAPSAKPMPPTANRQSRAPGCENG